MKLYCLSPSSFRIYFYTWVYLDLKQSVHVSPFQPVLLHLPYLFFKFLYSAYYFYGRDRDAETTFGTDAVWSRFFAVCIAVIDTG